MHNRDHWEERREKGAKKKLWLIFFFLILINYETITENLKVETYAGTENLENPKQDEPKQMHFNPYHD